MAVDYPNPWMYRGRPFTSEKIKDYYGFLYLIENTITGRKYIGRKYFVQKRKPKGGKRRVTSESDWKKYYGSNDQLKADVKEHGMRTSKERSYPYMRLWVRLTMRRQKLSSSTTS